MARHTVSFQLPERRLGKSDIEIKVRKDKALFGRILISRGAVEWVPRDKQHKFRVSWQQLAKLLESGRKLPKKSN